MTVDSMTLLDTGNEQADRLSREEGQLDPEDRYTSHTEEKAVIKTLSNKKMEAINTQTPTSQTASTN